MAFPYVRNIILIDSYEFLQKYIHFVVNDKNHKKGIEIYNHLFKVSYVLEKLINIAVKVCQTDKI